MRGGGVTDAGGQEARPLNLTGRQLGPYRLEAPLGDGTVGRAYRARHVVLDSLRAVEVVPFANGRDGGLRERFLGSARSAARLRHPNIVPVCDYGLESEWQFLVTEY